MAAKQGTKKKRKKKEKTRTGLCPWTRIMLAEVTFDPCL